MKNFPHQYNTFARIRGALETVRDLLAAGRPAGDDGELGYELARRGIYQFRGLTGSIEDRIVAEQSKPQGSQGARTAARETRRTLSLLGFIQDSPGWALTQAGGDLLASTPSSSTEQAIWQRALVELELEEANGAKSHPVRILLRLVDEKGRLAREDMGLALETVDDSEAEFARITSLLAAPVTNWKQQLGVSKYTAANSVKILPALAEQAGLIVRSGSKRHYVLNADGRAALGAVYEAKPLSAAAGTAAPSITLPKSPPTTHRGAPRSVTSATAGKSSSIDPSTWATLSTEEQLAATRLRFERTTRHQDLVSSVANTISADDADLQEDPSSFDLLHVPRSAAEPLILFEMKTLDTDAFTQVRLAIGQLYSYEFLVVRPRYPGRDVVRALVTDGPIGDELAGLLEWAQIAAFEWRGNQLQPKNPSAQEAIELFPSAGSPSP